MKITNLRRHVTVGPGGDRAHEPATGRVRAVWNGAVLAESDRTIVIEGNHYFRCGTSRSSCSPRAMRAAPVRGRARRATSTSSSRTSATRQPPGPTPIQAGRRTDPRPRGLLAGRRDPRASGAAGSSASTSASTTCAVDGGTALCAEPSGAGPRSRLPSPTEEVPMRLRTFDVIVIGAGPRRGGARLQARRGWEVGRGHRGRARWR